MSSDDKTEGWGMNLRYSPSEGLDFSGPVEQRIGLPKRFEIELTGPHWEYDIKLEVAVVSGVAECTELRFAQRPGGPRVTGLDARAPVERIVRAAVRRLAFSGQRRSGGAVHATPIPYEEATAAGKRRRRPSPGSEPDVRLAAQIWLEELLLDSSAPTKRTAERMFVSEATVRRWLRLARERGLLPADYKALHARREI